MNRERDYPLKWPEGWPRTLATARRSAPYKTSLQAAVNDLLADLRRMRATDIVISSNVRSSLIKQTESDLRDPGVAVYWLHKDGSPRVMACDHWHRLRDNVRGVGLTIAALRQIERCGATGMLDRALDGFKALPAAPTWREVLQLPRSGPVTAAQVTTQFRALAATHHPDRGGDTVTFGQITQAYREALSACQ